MQKVDVTGFDPDGPAEEGSGIFGLDFGAEASNVILLPVPWEPTTSYGHGTARGPAAIRRASHQVDLYDAEMAADGLPDPWAYGIHLEEADPEVAAWNEEACRLAAPVIERGGMVDDAPELAAGRDRVDALCEAVHGRVREQAARWHGAGKLVGVVGGDHSTALGGILAAAERYEGLGILQVDAHADLRQAYEGFTHSHASILWNALERAPGIARVVQVGVRDLCGAEAERIRADTRVECFFDHALKERAFSGAPWRATCEAIVERLPERVYITFDIDGLDPAFCPHTGTPVPGGLGFAEAVWLLRAVARSGRTIVGFDLTEVAPAPDPADEWDGNVGARLLYKLCATGIRSRLTAR